MKCQHNNCEKKSVCIILLPSGHMADSCLMHAQGHKILIKSEVKEWVTEKKIINH